MTDTRPAMDGKIGPSLLNELATQCEVSDQNAPHIAGTASDHLDGSLPGQRLSSPEGPSATNSNNLVQ